MAINERLIHTAAEAVAAGTGNQQEGLILHLDANDVDSYDGDGSIWYDIADHEYTPATNVLEHFNTVTYTGTSATNSITGVGFQPDLIWLKQRSNAQKHGLFDSVRGANNFLSSDLTDDAETRTTDTLSSFDSDGFTLTGYTSDAFINYTGRTMVAWCFKAGGAPTASTPFMVDGTGYATMSAAGFTDGTEALDSLSVNTKLGFSIAKWSGTTALTGDTVAHGLGETPELIIHKSTSLERDWNVFHKDVGTSKNLHLNQNHEARTNEYWTVNSNTHSIHDTSTSGDWIAYSFTSRRGVSKVGSYEGNSSSTGVKVHTGFEPAFIMFKPADAATGWSIHDNKRGTDKQLNPDIDGAETTGWSPYLEFLSDGFKVKGSSSGLNPSSTMIYLAFAAEKPDSLTPAKADFTEGTVESGAKLELNANNYYGSGNWEDNTANNHDATLTGTPTYVDDGNSDYFEFDASNDYMTIPHSTDLDISTSFTVEAWVNRDDNGEGYIISKASGTSGAYGWFLQFHNNSSWGYTFQTYSTSNSTGSARATIAKSGTAGKWQHVVGTYDGTNTKIYVDGDLKATTALSGTPAANTAQVVLGAYYNYGAKFDGKIAQVRVYQTALSSSEVKTNYDATKGLYQYPDLELHLDPASYSGSGTTWTADVGNNGTLVGNTSYDQELGDFFDLDGSGDYISLNTTGYLEGDFTVEMWWNFDSFSSSYQMLWGSQGYSTGTGLGGYIYGNGTLWTYISLNGTASAPMGQSGTVLTAGKWHHIVTTRSGGTYTNYVDGVQIQTGTGSTASLASNNTYIGSHYNTPTLYDVDGRVGQVRVYNKALTAEQIRQNHGFTKNDYPSGFNGTISSAAWNDGSGETNTPGYFSFNGSASVNTTLDLSGTNFGGFSISTWFRMDTTNTYNAIFGDSNIVMWIGGGDMTGSYTDESLYLYQSSPVMETFGREGQAEYADDNWHQLIVTCSGTATTDKKFYVDGVLQSMQYKSGQTTNWTFTDLQFGQAFGGTYNHNGDIAEAKVFDKALSLSEVKAEFNLRCEEFGLTKLT